MAKFTHPSLVRFCGVCLDPPLLVMEYYRNRDLYSMLGSAHLELVQADVEQHRTNKVRSVGGRAALSAKKGF